MQRELPGQWLLEVGYAGSRGWDLTTGGGGQAGEIDLNAIPGSVPLDEPVRDQATIDFLAQLVTNPFASLMPGTGFNGATIARSQLLRPYPQFGNVRTFDDDGTSRYNSAQAKIEKRFTRGYTVLAAYTWSQVHRARVQAQSERQRLRGAAVGVRRAAPRRAQRHLGAAVRQRPAVGQRRLRTQPTR